MENSLYNKIVHSLRLILFSLFVATALTGDASLFSGTGSADGKNKSTQTDNAKKEIANAKPPFHFNDKQVILKFGMISDTHMQYTNGVSSQKLESALEQLYNRSAGKMDALLISGDLTDYGMPAQVVELKRVFDASKVNFKKTRLVFAIGNHEYNNTWFNHAQWNGGYLFKDVLGDIAYTGASDWEIKNGDYHAVVNGIHLIAINCTQYDGGVKYTDYDISWLKEQLKKAAAQNEHKPIFVISHPNITGTNIGSNDGSYWAAADLSAIFKDYPQVVFFCGHLHYPENDERSIWQGDFTTVGVGSTYYCSNHPTDDENGNNFIDIVDGMETADCMQVSQGFYVEVDKQNEVRITRLDFANKAEIKTPWILATPQRDKSNLSRYTPAAESMRQGKKAPEFNANAFIEEVAKFDTGKGTYQVRFAQAKDNDLVYSYQISFLDAKSREVIKTISTLSDFYLHPDPKDMAAVLTKTVTKADSVLAPFSLHTDKPYLLRIVAVNCYGQKSEPVYSKIIEGVIPKKN